MRIATFLMVFVGCGCGAIADVPNPPHGFKSCTVPWQNIAAPGPSDDPKTGCQAEGSKHSYDTTPMTAAGMAQNRAKNNFCDIPDEKPVDLDIATLAALQAHLPAIIAFGGASQLEKSLSDRSVLQVELPDHSKFHEGQQVRIVGIMFKAKFSDNYSPKLYGVKKVGKNPGEGGESVNCNLPAEEQNDIHIALVEQAGQSECTSVTAEMSPHLRPTQWTAIVKNQKTHAALVEKLPVRITGQLFFDAMHKPCDAAGKPDGPSRQSLWEVHPVYKIDVCSKTTVKECSATDEKLWTPLDQWKP